MNKAWFDKIIETNDSIEITITKEDIYDELYDVCDREHASCNPNCPVYALAIQDGEFDMYELDDCPYFKNGRKMFERLRGKKLRKPGRPKK